MPSSWFSSYPSALSISPVARLDVCVHKAPDIRMRSRGQGVPGGGPSTGSTCTQTLNVHVDLRTLQQCCAGPEEGGTSAKYKLG